MPELRDTRRTVTATTDSTRPTDIGAALTRLLQDNPETELPTIRLAIDSDDHVHLTGKIGAIVGSRCIRCNGYWHDPEGNCIDSPRPYVGDPAKRQQALDEARAAARGAETIVATQCPSCHAPAGRPHTDYCQLANWAGHRDLCPIQWGQPCDCTE